MYYKRLLGFALVELLIALAILSVVAVFTIPKVILAQQNQANNAKAKEVASIISVALQQLKLRSALTANTRTDDLTPLLNYVNVESGAVVDDFQGNSSASCAADGSGWNCLRLHNGAVFYYWPGDQFCGTATTNGIPFRVDPDGRYSGTTNGPGKAVSFFLYYDGKITTEGTAFSNTSWSCGHVTGPVPSRDPPWFHW